MHVGNTAFISSAVEMTHAQLKNIKILECLDFSIFRYDVCSDYFTILFISQSLQNIVF